MNFLAHALLAGPDPQMRIGGLMGDFVKGHLPGPLPAPIAAGVRLHRRIDVYADAHPAFRSSCARVAPLRRRYAGIMTDLFYDHFLTRHWPRFSDEPLAAFVSDTYQLLSRHEHLLSDRHRRVAQAMRSDDWLASYGSVDTVGHALDRLSQRLRRQPNPLRGALEELQNAYDGFESDFLAFFPDAMIYAATAVAPARTP